MRNIALLLCLVNGLMTGQTFQVVYSFAEVTSSTGSVAPGTVPQVTGLVLGSFTAAGVSAHPNASGRFSFTGWPAGAIDGEDNHALYTGALSPFSYYELMLTVQPGYTLSLERISFAVRRSGTGIRHYSVRSNLDSFTSNLAASTGTNSKITVLPDNVFFWKYDNTSTSSDQKGSSVSPGTAHHSITGNLIFRFYAWNAEAGSGSFSIDDVVLSGNVLDSALLNHVTQSSIQECLAVCSGQNVGVPCDWNSLEVRDVNGRVLWRGDRSSCSGSPHLAAGLYVVFARTEKTLHAVKLLVPFR